MIRFVHEDDCVVGAKWINAHSADRYGHVDVVATEMGNLTFGESIGHEHEYEEALGMNVMRDKRNVRLFINGNHDYYVFCSISSLNRLAYYISYDDLSNEEKFAFEVGGLDAIVEDMRGMRTGRKRVKV